MTLVMTDAEQSVEFPPLPLRERDAGQGFDKVSVRVRGKTAHEVTLVKHAFAQRLRREQTDCERKLWYALRNRRLSQHKFRRQQPIGSYVVDFVCFETGLIVELDGSQHDQPENIAADRARTNFLESKGYRVLRFRNLALIESFDDVLNAIFAASRE